MTFRTLCIWGGVLTIGLVARLQRVSLAIPQGELKGVFRLAVPNVMVWHALLIYGVKMLSSGRAAILGYTMPTWAALSAVLFFGERLEGRALLGIALAFGGALLLLSSEFSTISGQPLGTLLVLGAAAGWGYGTVLLKRTPVTMPTIALTFWMLLFASLLMTALSFALEWDVMRAPGAVTWGAILFNALVIFGFAHVAWFKLARALPPVASSLSVMLIPVVGVFSGMWLLGESPHWQDYAAIALILASMATVLLRRG